MGYDVRYRHVYTMLKQHGHTAAKALEIVLSATRGDCFALKWIRTMRQLSR